MFYIQNLFNIISHQRLLHIIRWPPLLGINLIHFRNFLTFYRRLCTKTSRYIKSSSNLVEFESFICMRVGSDTLGDPIFQIHFESPIFALCAELAKLGKASQDAYNPGGWLIL